MVWGQTGDLIRYTLIFMQNRSLIFVIILLSVALVYFEKSRSSWAIFESKERGLILINRSTGETFRSVRFTYLKRSPLGWEKIYRYPEESDELHERFPQEQDESMNEAILTPSPTDKKVRETTKIP